MQQITQCLWFENQAAEAAEFYTSIFKNSKILNTTRYGKAGQEIHGRSPGSIMTITFELNGQEMTALNGGPHFKFNEAVSFVVNCKDQEEVDYYWQRLCESGDKAAQQCGWLKDKFGLSWQVVPSELPMMLNDPDREKADRVMTAMLQMKKLDIKTLKAAYNLKSAKGR